MKLPQDFLTSMQDLLNADYPDFITSYQQPRTNGLRVNTLKITVSEFLNRSPFNCHSIPWCPEGFYYDYATYPGQHPYFAAGLYYLQEPSAMAVVSYLDPQPGEWVLDLAAAPGGKSTQIASRLSHSGLLWSNEINAARARILRTNLERWGACNTIVSNESPDRLATQLGSVFDRLLLDAPCSGEGMFRKDPDACKEWSIKHVSACALRQQHILNSAADLLKPGGRLVYSTCTFNRTENEDVILKFLDQHPEFKPLKLPVPDPRFQESELIPGAVRLYPHRLPGEGHFIAVLEKTAPADPQKTVLPSAANRKHPSKHSSQNPRLARTTEGKHRQKQIDIPLADAIEEFKRFKASVLKTDCSIFEDQSPAFTLFGSQLYLNPVPEISLAGMKIASPGLHLGEKKPGRFQPSPALALYLNSDATPHYLGLDLKSTELQMYLRGESFASPGPDGWVLIGVEEFPLGWAKRTQGQLKNHYPKDWRFTPKLTN